MFEASFSAFLETVLIILLVYFGFKLLIRWFGPLILRYFLKKMGKKFEQQFNQRTHHTKTKEEGEISIDKKKSSSRKSNKEVGEYIDYEEID